MQWILTGEEEHWKDSEALGREAGVEKKVTDAQKRMLGKKTAKRRNKKALLKHRPDKTQTEKRRAMALSNTKTE